MKFFTLASYMKRIEETASRNEMTEILSQLFSESDADEIGNLCYLLQGRVAPLYEATEFGIADKLMIRAIAQAYTIDASVVTQEFKKAGDLGIAAQLVLNATATPSHSDKKLTVSAVFEQLLNLANAGGAGSQEEKITIIANLLSHVDPLSVRYIVQIGRAHV